MLNKFSEVTDVFRVHRDMLDEIREELHESKERWADDIVSRVVEEVNQNIINRVMEEIEPDKFWEDLTDKEFRLTVIE